MFDHKSVRVSLRGGGVVERLSANPPKPFHISTKNLRGHYAHRSSADGRNWLPLWAREILREDFIAAEKGWLYIVYSYQTPIAWRTHDGIWRIPDVRYSVSTSRHQGLIRYATHTGD